MNPFSKYFRRSIEVIINEGMSTFFKGVVRRLLRVLLVLKEAWFTIIRNIFSRYEKKVDFYSSSKPDVICLPIIDWYFRYQRPQQILSLAALDGSRVFYIKPDYFTFLKNPRVTFIKRNIINVTISSKMGLNINRDILDKSNLRKMTSSIDLLRKKYAIVNAVILVQFPFWWPLAKKLRESYGWKIVYDCLDDHTVFQTVKKNRISYEKGLIEESDLITVSSKTLLEKVERLGKTAVIIPNGTDHKHFSNLKRNGKLDKLSRPIIGYYGAISAWFDNEIVEFIAESKKQWNIVLIGHTFGAKIAKLRKMSNVLLLGEVNYQNLPGYLSYFDICILPFKLSQFVEAVNPVKFYEMMSAGKPVVSVKLPELDHYNDYVYLSYDKESFLNNIEKALKENNPIVIQKRVNFAKNNSWDIRYGIFKEHLIRLFPKVSVIIISYNNLKYTRLCLQSILENTQYPNYEIIIIDNASNDGTRLFLTEFSSQNMNVNVILNEKNLGFPKANNQGLKVSSGEYIVLLNNDVVVTRGWLSKLLRHLDNQEIGMVGPVTNFCGNEAKIEVPYIINNVTNLKKMQEFAESYIKKHLEPSFFKIDMLAMFCVAMRRDAFEKIGFLDEQFGIGMFEDDDYALRLKNAGYKLICAEDIFVHHFGKAAFNNVKNYDEIFNENKQKFEKKWKIRWEPPKYRVKIGNWRL
jgi:GT2 family glycosyltransferase/glycosyltransferase involved in cell wall biosynthesis